MSSIATYREHGHRDAIAPADDPTVSTNLVRTAAVTPRLFVIVTEGDNRVPLSHAGRVPNADSARKMNRYPRQYARVQNAPLCATAASAGN